MPSYGLKLSCNGCFEVSTPPPLTHTLWLPVSKIHYPHVALHSSLSSGGVLQYRAPGYGFFAWPCSCYALTMRLGGPDQGLQCNSVYLLLHVLASLAVNSCYLESQITGMGVSPG
jgi:hypothetical protein